MGPCRNLPCISIHALREEGDTPPASVAYRHNDFYPRPPRGGRRQPVPSDSRFHRISIHALREEGDTRRWARRSGIPGFLSTPSARRATVLWASARVGRGNFYPRPPRGGRPAPFALVAIFFRFLSTPSARRATRVPCGIMATVFYFYPRPPRGGRLVSSWSGVGFPRFLSTPSARRAT